MLALRPFLRIVTIAASMTAAAAMACASCGEAAVTPVADATTPDTASNVSPAACPDTPPKEGATCTLPAGTTCAFGTCATYAICREGTWRLPASPKPLKLCPTLVPDEGAACGDCFEDGGTCTYGDPTCTDASTNAAQARCTRGKFSIEIVTCVEAGSDATAGDAGARDAANDGG